MDRTGLKLKKVQYGRLNGRQKENYNFQKLSASLADFGFATMRLSDDWKGADFIAYHIDGSTFLRVQLKTRPCVDCRYLGKEIWIAFRKNDEWYIYPHDDLLRWAVYEKKPSIGRTKGWEIDDPAKLKGRYNWPHLSKAIRIWLSPFRVAEGAREQ